MNTLSDWPAWLDSARGVPVLDGIARRWVRRHFESRHERNLFLGVFDSFEEAARHVPERALTGYDHEATGNLYRRHMTVDTYDYPALFWLQRSFEEGMRSVFDLGGSIGIKFYAFAKLIAYPPDLRWTVADVGASVRQGRALAAERHETHRLAFTEDHAELSGCDVLYASGTLQYLPTTLAALLDAAPAKPRRLVINTTAIHPAKSFFTVNSLGGASFCPYRVQALDPFCRALEASGYAMRDQWSNAGKLLELPLDPEHSLDRYMGFCFDRVATAAAP